MYTKLFASMYDGTLRTRAPWPALVTFQQMLILCDPAGVCDMTAEALAFRTGLPLEVIQTGIAALESPDPDSRLPNDEGRRIVRLDDHRSWGWRIVNFVHYRNLQSNEARREYQKNLMRKRRSPNGGKGVSAGDVPLARVSTGEGPLAKLGHANADADAEASATKPKTQARKRAIPLPPEFGISGRVREWAADKGHTQLEERLDHFIGYAKANGKTYVDWDEALMNAIRDDWAKLDSRKTKGGKLAAVGAAIYGATDDGKRFQPRPIAGVPNVRLADQRHVNPETLRRIHEILGMKRDSNSTT